MRIARHMAQSTRWAAAFGLKTIPAQNRTPLRGKKWDSGFRTAFRADGAGLGARAEMAGTPFCLARFATLRIVAELLLVEEELFARGKNELAPAVHAL